MAIKVKAKKKVKGCSLKPQNIDAYNWYYEYPGHIELIHEVRHGTGCIRTDSIRIPRRKLAVSLERMSRRA